MSHDEVVHCKGSLLSKMPGDTWQKFANLRALYGFLFTHPGKKLLFMGGEFGQWREWNENESLDWHLLAYDPHRQLQQLVGDLNRLYRGEPSLYEVDFQHTGFEWIDFSDVDHSIISFLRRAQNRDDHVVVVCNFTPVARYGYRIGVPLACFYREVINTDAAHYGGSGVTHGAGVQADPQPWHNQPCSVQLNLPPLGVLILKPERTK
jgi:1,4-alpha-glucan branching enzyme